MTPPPVVVILGHIDHGKSTLLHKIRDTRAPKEAGDITQHIGAYQAEAAADKKTKKKQLITFIDTPGHKAFDTVREHGANFADVAIVVVAADEGIKAQTKDVLKLVQEAKLPYIIAVNKIDKPDANVEAVKKDLGTLNIYIEEWGGDVPLVEVSAEKGTGIDNLLEMILLVYEIQERQVHVDGPVSGVVLTAGIDPKSGRYASLLVQQGTLKMRDDIFITGVESKVKIMTDASGKSVAAAGPSTPVFIKGLKDIPAPGDVFSTEKDGEVPVVEASAGRIERDPFAVDEEKLNLIIKADSQSSLDAISKSLKELKIQDYKIIKQSVGNINKNDAELASTGEKGALIFGFHVAIDPQAEMLIKQKELLVRTYDVIYDLIDTITKIIKEGLVANIIKEDLGALSVLKVFLKKKGMMIVGGKVADGKLAVNAKVDVVRGEEVLGTGTIKELQQGQAQVKEVTKGHECGLTFSGETVIKEEDILKAYVERTELPEL